MKFYLLLMAFSLFFCSTKEQRSDKNTIEKAQKFNEPEAYLNNAKAYPFLNVKLINDFPYECFYIFQAKRYYRMAYC